MSVESAGLGASTRGPGLIAGLLSQTVLALRVTIPRVRSQWTRSRKYLNAAERRRFFRAAAKAEPETRIFCFALGWSGARISEILALVADSIDLDIRAALIETLKRRKRGIVRQVPLPGSVLVEFNRVFKLRRRQRDPRLAVKRLWKWSRATAWRRVKDVMRAANITGLQAMPKALRHSFGAHPLSLAVPRCKTRRRLDCSRPIELLHHIRRSLPELDVHMAELD